MNSDLISRSTLLEMSHAIAPCTPDNPYNSAAVVDVEDIVAAPAVDAVEVVRCGKCENGEVDDPDFPTQYYCRAGCGWNNETFYCAYGERRTE